MGIVEMDFADAFFSVDIGLILQVVQGHGRGGDCLTLFKPGGGGVHNIPTP